MISGPPKTLADAIDAVEGAYEFMLAYAAQGRVDDPGDDVRDWLGRARPPSWTRSARTPPAPASPCAS